MLKRTPLKQGNKPLKTSSGLKSSNSLKKGVALQKSAKSEERLEEDKLKKDKRTQFYLECAKISNRRSDVSGDRIGGERIHFHHLFPKSTNESIEFSFLCILQVTWNEHANLESDLDYYPVAKERREWIRENWEKIEKDSKLWEENYMKNR
jgi:hypothetical protein